MESWSRYEGCLVGGAIGDALGYPVEFMSWDDIRAHYGARGITDYKLHGGQALVSDDTQMTLFTATAILYGQTRARWRGIMDPTMAGYLWAHYRDWLKTQGRGGGENFSWLTRVPALNALRAPGNTCLAALSSRRPGSMEEPINDSKGCGGVMRVAPIGLYFGRHLIGKESGTPGWATLREADRVGAIAAALTHGHELGYIPAAGLVHIVARAAHGPQRDLESIVLEARCALAEEFAGRRHLPTMLQLIDQAVDLAHGSVDDQIAIARLGEGWVAEETLAIAIYCSLKYSGDFERAVIAAVNHDGDSDSTGSVTGNILGAFLGREAIPERWVAPLDCRDVLETVARDLCADVPPFEAANEQEKADLHTWSRKYVEGVYP